MPRTRRRLGKHLGSIGLVSLAALGAVGFTGCIAGEDDGPCVSDQMFFAEQVWAPILSNNCIACHTSNGAAKDSSLVLRGSSEAGFLDTNYDIMKNAAALQQDGMSQLLAMPTGGTASRKHPGGVVIQPGSEEFKALEELVNRFNEPSSCETNLSATFTGVQLATPAETLRKAALSLVGRLPTVEEEDTIEAGGIRALDPILDQMMTEEAFYTRLKEVYNDQFLTDRYLGNEDAVQLLNDIDYYNPYWYDQFFEGANADPKSMEDGIDKYGAWNADDLYNKLRSWTNRGVAREPLELVAHVVRENRPFSEILTANYIMVNPFSAKAFMLGDLAFKNDADPNEFIEAQIPTLPHAGVLSSPMFLNRFPTTETNRNRARARMVYQFFLGTDILKTGQQPLDQTLITEVNPTLNAAACQQCHVEIDPVAGAFRHWNGRAAYDPMTPPLDDMRPPGFKGEKTPYETLPQGLQWLAPRVAADPRFALSAVYIIFEGLTGQKPLVAPQDRKAADFSTEFQAYLAEYTEFSKIAREFEASNYDLKVVVKQIVHSPYFRAKNSGSLDTGGKARLGEVGMGRLVTPEQLHRKIQAVLGYPWRPRAYEDGGGTYDYLLRGDAYRMLYGGIDSADVVKRVLSPNGIMANIGERMANEMSCISVPRDMWKPTEERTLFPYVETSFEPEDKNGFPVEPAVVAIKKNIQHLHKHILGETLPDGHPEIERTYKLFLETYREGVKGMSDMSQPEGKYSTWLAGPCRVENDYWTRTPLPEEDRLREDPTYVIRSWMTVVTYMLSDYHFLYE